MAEKPNEEEIKKVLELAKKKSEARIDKSKERITDKSVPGKEKPPEKKEPDKLDMVLKRLDRLEELYNKGVVTPTANPISEKKATGQEKQASSEQLLKEAELEQEKAAGQGQPGQQAGQPQGQLSPEQYQALSPEQKVPILEAQLQQQQGQMTSEQAAAHLQQTVNQAQQLQQQQGGQLTGQQRAFVYTELAKAAGNIIPAILQGRGGGASGGGVAPMIENFKTFGELSKVFSQIQTNIAKGYSDSLKVMTPEVRQEVAGQMLRGNPNLPGFQTSPSSLEQRINP